MATSPPPYIWNEEASRLAEFAHMKHALNGLEEAALPPVSQSESGAPVPFDVWRGVFELGVLLFDVKSPWWGRHESQRTKRDGSLQEPFTMEEFDAHLQTIQALLESCEPTTLENFWLSIWEQWEEHKKPGRAWFLPTMAIYPCRANAYRLLNFYLTLSDCYLVRNMGQQQSGRMLVRWNHPVARHVLDLARHRMREDYERKALTLALEDELAHRTTTLDAWLTPKTEADFGLDHEGRRVFDFGTRQIEMQCSLSARTITWRELPSDRELKSFPRKKKRDDPLLFSLARLRYRSMRDELERAYL